MSFVTSCPECATHFIVRPEHLSAQRGMVRCGKCNHVFNALDQLKEANAVTSLDIAPTTIPPDDGDYVNDATEVSAADNIPEIHISEQQIEISDSPSFPTAEPENESTPPTVDASDIIPWPLIPSDAAKPSEEIPHILRDVALKDKIKPSRRPKASAWELGFFTFLLLLLISAQSIYYLRTTISTNRPALKPHLEQACKLLACKVELPKNADLLVIDDSDLHEDPEHKGLIHLTSTMINNAPYAQDYPLLELTLTDANDTPLLRRSFKPQEYMPANNKLNSGIPAGDEVHIHLPITAGSVAVAGYRVFVTYR